MLLTVSIMSVGGPSQ